jgi:hypothetical protein
MKRLETLRNQYPNWDIDEPHRLGPNTDCMGHPTEPHWRMWASPKGCHTSRYTITAFGPDNEGWAGVIADMAKKLVNAAKAYHEEM